MKTNRVLFFDKEHLRKKKESSNENMIAEMKSQQKLWKIRLNKKSEMENREEEIRKREIGPGDTISE